jgi:NitT/TauT family transport system permease protein
MRDSLKLAGATAFTFCVILALWVGLIRIYDVPAYVVPMPQEIGAALWRGWIGGTFWDHAWFTLQGALGGFGLGALLGVIAGVIVAEVRIARLVFYPMVVAIQSMPTVAVAPLIVVYLGVGLPSKIATVALLCFFPVFVNVVAGIQAADPRLVDLYRASAASRVRILCDVKLPGAADNLFSALQVALVLSFVGCVVSEFIASRAGLGHLIKTFATDLNVSVMFAAIVSLAIIGACLGLLLAVLHKRVVFWRR